jgi:glucose-6-phosphate 1-epimerase
MSTYKIENDHLTLPEAKAEKGLEYFDLITPNSRARVFLQGGHITEFTSDGNAVIWVSDAVDYTPGTAIRGGVPICWPWFGAAPSALVDRLTEQPAQVLGAHGLVRTALWQFKEQVIDETGVSLTLELPKSVLDAASTQWPYQCALELTLHLSDTLTITLTTTNLDDTPFEFTQALHSYFAVGDIDCVKTHGLEGCPFLEFGESFSNQNTNVIDKEVDRIYQDTPNLLSLETKNTVIDIVSNSHSAILWNPWIEKSKGLSSFNDNDYMKMVCLESANVGKDKVFLHPNERHSLHVTLSVK